MREPFWFFSLITWYHRTFGERRNDNGHSQIALSPCPNTAVLILANVLPDFFLPCSNILALLHWQRIYSFKDFFFILLYLVFQLPFQNYFPRVFMSRFSCFHVGSCELVLRNLLTFAVVAPSCLPLLVTQAWRHLGSFPQYRFPEAGLLDSGMGKVLTPLPLSRK